MAFTFHGRHDAGAEISGRAGVAVKYMKPGPRNNWRTAEPKKKNPNPVRACQRRRCASKFRSGERVFASMG